MNVLRTPRPQRGQRGEALEERTRARRRKGREPAEWMRGPRARGGEAPGDCGEGLDRGEGTQGPAEAKDARFIRQARMGGRSPGGKMGGLRTAAPLRRGAANCSTPGLPGGSVRGVPESRTRSKSGPPALGRPGPPPPPPPGPGVWCLRRASVGAGAAAGVRRTLGPAGALGAEERGARGRAASSSCRTGPRRPAAAAETEHGRRRRPGRRRARSGSGSGCFHCQLSTRSQRRQPQQHYRRRPGWSAPAGAAPARPADTGRRTARRLALRAAARCPVRRRPGAVGAVAGSPGGGSEGAGKPQRKSGTGERAPRPQGASCLCWKLQTALRPYPRKPRGPRPPATLPAPKRRASWLAGPAGKPAPSLSARTRAPTISCVTVAPARLGTSALV